MRQLLGAASGVTNAARFEDIPVAGNPSGLIGLAASNGVASTWMRSDATHALDLTIAPVWAGAHQFSALVKANLGLTVAGGAFTSRGITDNSSANALSIAAAGNQTLTAASSSNAIGGFTTNIVAPTTSGASNGLLIVAGTTTADNALSVLNAAHTQSFFVVGGTGAIAFGAVATTTTAPGTGTAGALPAKPKGYFSITVAGVAAQVPYY